MVWPSPEVASKSGAWSPARTLDAMKRTPSETIGTTQSARRPDPIPLNVGHAAVGDSPRRGVRNRNPNESVLAFLLRDGLTGDRGRRFFPDPATPREPRRPPMPRFPLALDLPDPDRAEDRTREASGLT